MPANSISPYDVVLYPSYTRVQTHPDRLATIGRLLGMSPAPVEKCRVLELGCGNGSNLTPIAFSLPESEFVGLDLATKPIATAQCMARDLGVSNITFRQGSITDVNREFGEFDYIICHGVYSWVPEPVRESILRVGRECLRPNGIAFVSYNAYPGNRLREMIREMMLFHVRGFDQPSDQIAQARALAEFAAAAQDQSDLYRQFLKQEMETFLRQDQHYVFHDALAEINTPFYFHQFIEAAQRHQLKYLGEADFHVMLDATLPTAVARKLDELSANRIAREQYLDFLRCRRFRQTLLCHENVELDLSLKPNLIADFHLAGMVRCDSAECSVQAKSLGVFQNPQGAKIQTDSPLAKVAFLILREEFPQAIPFPELWRRVRDTLSEQGWKSEDEKREESELRTILFRSFGAGLIELHTYSPKIWRQVSRQPKASPLARWQAAHANFINSLFHSTIHLHDEIAKELLTLLDGTRDRDVLLNLLAEKLEQAKAKRGLTAKPIAQDAEAQRLLSAALDQNLLKLARLGLLVS